MNSIYAIHLLANFANTKAQYIGNVLLKCFDRCN